MEYRGNRAEDSYGNCEISSLPGLFLRGELPRRAATTEERGLQLHQLRSRVNNQTSHCSYSKDTLKPNRLERGHFNRSSRHPMYRSPSHENVAEADIPPR